MSLTSRIQALTAYANEVTGESDTTLADAVATLAEGYGQGGDSYSLDDIMSGSEPSGDITTNISGNLKNNLMYGRTNLTGVTAPNVANIGVSCFYGCTNLTKLIAHSCGTWGQTCIQNTGITNLAVLHGGLINTYTPFTSNNLRVFDTNASEIRQNFGNCNNLTTLILRNQNMLKLTANNVFNGTPMKSGGAGVTVYIPKALYDELGTGTTLDYKSASNWSTYDGYGTITWAPIEGSIYETQYADGTPIE